jgi:hypothetical protein
MHIDKYKRPVGSSKTRWLAWTFWIGLRKSLNSARPHSLSRSALRYAFWGAFRGHVVETCSLPIYLSIRDYLWEYMIFLSMSFLCKPKYRTPIVKRVVKRSIYASSTIDLYYSNAWRLNDSEFLVLYSFIFLAYCDPEGTIKHELLPIYVEKYSFLSHVFSGRSVYCHPPRPLLVVQCVENLCTCHTSYISNEYQ